jgi:hypothetical protein
MTLFAIALLGLVHVVVPMTTGAAHEDFALSGDSTFLTACVCDKDNACMASLPSLDDEQDSVSRICFCSPDPASSLLSIDELSLKHADQIIHLLPSCNNSNNAAINNVTAVVSCDFNSTCVVEVLLPTEFFLEDDAICLANGTATISFDTGSLRGVSQAVNEVVDFETVLGSKKEQEDHVQLTSVAMVIGMALLLQSTWFLATYSFRRDRGDLES